MKNYIEIDGKIYVIDMVKFMAFVSQIPSNEKEWNTTITQVYAAKEDEEYITPHVSAKRVKKDEDINDITSINPFDVVTKEVTENKSKNNETFNQIRYDFAKTLLSGILTPIYNGDGTILTQNNEEDLLFGQKIIFNTLINEGILKEIGNE